LSNAVGVVKIPRLGFDDREALVAVFEDVVGLQRFFPPSRANKTTCGDRELYPDPATFCHAPASGFERRVNVVESGLGFVH